MALTPPTMVEHTWSRHVNVLHFTDANPDAVASELRREISWGDGATSSAAKSWPTPAAASTCMGTHRYGSPQTGVTFSVTVTDAGGATLHGEPKRAEHRHRALDRRDARFAQPSATSTLSDVPLCTFIDTDPRALDELTTGTYSATVNWGDGNQTTYVSADDDSPFTLVRVPDETVYLVTLYGSHTYSSALSEPFSVTITKSNDATISMTDTPPVVTSIACTGNQITVGATTLQFTLAFNEAVSGLTTSDFALTGGNSSGTISSVTANDSSDTTYTVTVTSVSGTGTLGLELVENTAAPITNSCGTPLGGLVVSGSTLAAASDSFTGQQYALSSEFYWDATGTGAGGGSGSFSAADWHVGDPAGPMLTPVNGADFILPAGTGTVTIAGQWTANSLTFQGGGAVLQNTSSTDSLTLLGSGDVTVNTGTAAINIVLAGSGGLTKLGSGTLALGTADTFTGVTSINAGTLLLGDSAGSGGIQDSSQVLNYAILSIASGTTFSEHNTLDNYGTLTCGGALDCYGGLTSNGTFDIESGGSVIVEIGGTFATWGDLENYGSLEVAGQMYAQGVYNTYGTTTLDEGGGLAAWTNVALAGPITDNGTLLFWDGGVNMTYGGAISGTGCIFTACGNSTVTLTGNNSNFAGLVYLASGTLQMGANSPTAWAAVRRWWRCRAALWT